MRHVSTKLLQIFVLLMEYRDLGAVAAYTRGRVPTVAYSLARLREITGDPLFVKRKGVLEPTPHALRLEQTARLMLAKWAQIVRGDEPPPEAAAHGARISIGFSASIGDPVITEILTALCEQFPHNHFVTRPVRADAALSRHLEQGEIDCAFVIDSQYAAAGIAQHSILATPRRLVSAARPGSEAEPHADGHWILLQEDSEPGSPLRTYLARHAGDPGHRETVAPSWHTQISLLRATGGICPLLDFNVPLVARDQPTRLLPTPNSFPDWAALHFWMPARTRATALHEMMEIGSAILRDPAKALEQRRAASERQAACASA